MKQLAPLLFFAIYIPSYCAYHEKFTQEENKKHLQSMVKNHLLILKARSQDGSKIAKEALNLFTRWSQYPKKQILDGSTACQFLMDRGLASQNVLEIAHSLLNFDKEKP